MNNRFLCNEHLVSQIMEGNRNAYNFLVENYHDRIFSYALSLTNNYALTQDLIQNVFLKTWEHRDKLNPIFPVKSFLYKATYNEFVNVYHKNLAISKVEAKFIEAIEFVTSDENEEAMEKKKAIVFQEIQKLPPKCKEVFLLSKTEGLTNPEIATHLGISIKAVEAQITKAYSTLRKNCITKLHTIVFLLFGFRIN